MKRLLFIIISLLTLLPLCAEEDHSILYDWQNFDDIFSFNGLPDKYPIAVDEQKIYVGTSFGIVVIDKATGQQTLLNRTNGLTDNYICFLKFLGDELWYGGHDHSFGMIKNEKIYNYTRAQTHFPSTALITAMEKDKEGNLWIGSYGDLYKYTDGEFAGIYPFPNGEYSSAKAICDILADEDGFVWVTGYTGSEGLAKLTADGLEMVYEDMGIGIDLIKDHQGNMWMTAQHGLLKYKEGVFTQYLTDKNGESLGSLAYLTEDKDGNFWAVRGTSLIKYDGEQITSYQAPFNMYDMVLGDDGIYISCSHNGLLVFNDGEFEHIPLQEFPGHILPYNKVWAGMTHGGSIDHDGNYLAGTSSGHGLLKLTPDGTCTETDFFKGKYISETTTDNLGDIWVANSSGEQFYLYKITPTDTLTYNEASGCPHIGGEDIFQMVCDRQNRLWIASNSGIYCFDGTTWNTYNYILTGNHSYSIAFDKDDHLWMSCESGLFSFDGTTWIRYISQYDNEMNSATEDYVPLKMPIRTNSISHFAIDDNNTFWLAVNFNELYGSVIDGTHSGLIQWNGGDDWHLFVTPFTSDPSIPVDEAEEWANNVDFVMPDNWIINNIDFDRDGRLWVTFEGKYGVAMFDRMDFTVWDTDMPGIRNNTVFNLCVDKMRDRLWISHSYENGASTARILCTSATDMLSTPRLLPNLGGQQSGKMYNLSGRQITEPQKGEVYIQNGKKVFVK